MKQCRISVQTVSEMDSALNHIFKNRARVARCLLTSCSTSSRELGHTIWGTHTLNMLHIWAE